MHLPFDLAITPRLFCRRDNGFVVAADSSDERLQLRDLRFHACFQPSIQCIRIPILNTWRNCCAKSSAVATCGCAVVTACTQRCSSELRWMGGFVSQNATNRTLGSVRRGFDRTGDAFARQECTYSFTLLRCPL